MGEDGPPLAGGAGPWGGSGRRGGRRTGCPYQPAQAGRMAGLLVVSAGRTAGYTRGEGQNLDPQSNRRFRAGQAGGEGPRPSAASEQGGADPPGDVRSHG